LDHPSIVKAELERWQRKWIDNDIPKPSSAIETLPFCDDIFFPNIRRLILILATLPITTATAERSFSTLRRLKTYLRSTMNEERLNGLALLSIHNLREIVIEDVIDSLANLPRRSDFVL
jgi:hypothetical protein